MQVGVRRGQVGLNRAVVAAGRKGHVERVGEQGHVGFDAVVPVTGISWKQRRGLTMASALLFRRTSGAIGVLLLVSVLGGCGNDTGGEGSKPAFPPAAAADCLAGTFLNQAGARVAIKSAESWLRRGQTFTVYACSELPGVNNRSVLVLRTEGALSVAGPRVIRVGNSATIVPVRLRLGDGTDGSFAIQVRPLDRAVRYRMLDGGATAHLAHEGDQVRLESSR
jgi:hypothetical protein